MIIGGIDDQGFVGAKLKIYKLKRIELKEDGQEDKKTTITNS